MRYAIPRLRAQSRDSENGATQSRDCANSQIARNIYTALPLLPLHVKHSWHFLPQQITRTSTVDERKVFGFSSFVGGGCTHCSIFTYADSTLGLFSGKGFWEVAADSCSSLSLHVAMNRIFNSRG